MKGSDRAQGLWFGHRHSFPLRARYEPTAVTDTHMQEAEARGSHEPRNSRPGWAMWQDLVSKQNIQVTELCRQ